jgi:hypothetical protein
LAFRDVDGGSAGGCLAFGVAAALLKLVAQPSRPVRKAAVVGGDPLKRSCDVGCQLGEKLQGVQIPVGAVARVDLGGAVAGLAALGIGQSVQGKRTLGHVLGQVLQSAGVAAVDGMADEGIKPGRVPLQHLLNDVFGQGLLVEEQAKDVVLEQALQRVRSKTGRLDEAAGFQPTSGGDEQMNMRVKIEERSRGVDDGNGARGDGATCLLDGLP